MNMDDEEETTVDDRLRRSASRTGAAHDGTQAGMGSASVAPTAASVTIICTLRSASVAT